MNVTELYPILSNTFGVAVGTTIVVLAILLWLVYYITKKLTEYKERQNALKTTCSELNSKINENRKEVNERFERQMEEIRKDIAYIKGSLDIFKDNKAGVNLFQSNSPISLTKDGEKVAKELLLSGILSRRINDIISHIDSKNFKTPYDIQQYCIETSSVEPSIFYDQQGIDFVKDYAYKNGHSVQLYFRLLGLVIRDEYFKIKGIKVEDVDE